MQQQALRCRAVRGLRFQTARPGGWLVLRVNSRRDVYFGARGHTPIEPDFYRVGTRTKRFFDAADIHECAAGGWSIEHLEANVIDRYDHPKHVWTARMQRDALP